jgi:tetratricopeptide (TPR) repeat protein
MSSHMEQTTLLIKNYIEKYRPTNATIKKILKIENDITSYCNSIIINPNQNHSDCYYLIGRGYRRLAKIMNGPNVGSNGDQQFYELALDFHDKAINIFPDNSFYLIERTATLIALKKYDLALIDLSNAGKCSLYSNETWNNYVCYKIIHLENQLITIFENMKLD